MSFGYYGTPPVISSAANECVKGRNMSAPAIIDDKDRLDELFALMGDMISGDLSVKIIHQWLWRNIMDDTLPSEDGFRHPQQMMESLVADPLYLKEMVKHWLGGWDSDHDIIRRTQILRDELLQKESGLVSEKDQSEIRELANIIHSRGYFSEQERSKASSIYADLRRWHDGTMAHTRRGQSSR
jgi:hypothetical protein